MPVAQICRKAGISQATYFSWSKKYAALLPDEMRRLKVLEDENNRLKNIVADTRIQQQAASRVPERPLVLDPCGFARKFEDLASILQSRIVLTRQMARSRLPCIIPVAQPARHHDRSRKTPIPGDPGLGPRASTRWTRKNVASHSLITRHAIQEFYSVCCIEACRTLYEFPNVPWPLARGIPTRMNSFYAGHIGYIRNFPASD